MPLVSFVQHGQQRHTAVPAGELLIADITWGWAFHVLSSALPSIECSPCVHTPVLTCSFSRP